MTLFHLLLQLVIVRNLLYNSLTSLSVLLAVARKLARACLDQLQMSNAEALTVLPKHQNIGSSNLLERELASNPALLPQRKSPRDSSVGL